MDDLDKALDAVYDVWAAHYDETRKGLHASWNDGVATGIVCALSRVFDEWAPEIEDELEDMYEAKNRTQVAP